MHSHVEAKSLSSLMDVLLDYVPDGITGHTELGPSLVDAVYSIAMQIKKLRTLDTEHEWQAEILKKLDDVNTTPGQLRNLTYCVMYALDAKEEAPLVRSANSTFANVLLRQCATAFDNNLNELKPLIQLIYYNFDSQANRPGGISDPAEATASVLEFSRAISVDKTQIQGLELTRNRERKSSVTETKELPADIARKLYQTELQAYQNMLMEQAMEAAKTVTSFGIFNKKKEPASPQINQSFKHELPIVTACLKYLKSNNNEDKVAFMRLYAASQLSISFRTRMDKLFALDHPASSPKKSAP